MQNNTIHQINFSVKQWQTENVPTVEEVENGWFFGVAANSFSDTIVF